MAYAISNETGFGGISHRVGGFFRGVGQAIRASSEAQGRVEEIRRLQAKSDAELARLGIDRDRIPQHVFRDLFYI